MDVWEPCVVLEKRTELWETPSPTTLTHSGCSFWKAPPCQGHQCYCFFPISCCHLIHIEPVLPTIGIPLGPGLFTALMHQALCTYTSSPVRNSQKGISSWTPAPDLGGVSFSVRTVRGQTRDLCQRESSVEIRLAVPGVVGEAQEVGPSEAPPLMAGEATPLHPHWSVCCGLLL